MIPVSLSPAEERMLEAQRLLQAKFPWKFSQRGVGETEMLEQWYQVLQQPDSVITDVYRVTQYNDEPKMSMFHAAVDIPEKDKYFGLDGEGFSFFSPEQALLKCLGEAAERISNFTPSQDQVSASLTELIEWKVPFLNPRSVTGVSTKPWPSNTPILWTCGWSLPEKNPLLVPTSLVWLSERGRGSEPVILPPISTGSAGHSSQAAAVLSGIAECLERDAYMISYLNALPRAQLDLKSHEQLQHLQQKALAYGLELTVIDLSSDLPMTVFGACVTDRSSVGPALTIGLKAHLDPLTAAVGAVEEAFHPRSWLRLRHAELQSNQKKHLNNLVQRGLYWYDVNMIEKLDFWLSPQNPKKALQNFPSISKKIASAQLRDLLTTLQAQGQRVIAIPTTHPRLQGSRFYTVKTILPDLHPLHLQEKYRCLKSDRLVSVPPKLGFSVAPPEKINLTPHPFL